MREYELFGQSDHRAYSTAQQLSPPRPFHAKKRHPAANPLPFCQSGSRLAKVRAITHACGCIDLPFPLNLAASKSEGCP